MWGFLNLPNAFTLVRLALTPLIVACILAGRHTGALAIFAAAALTDVIDGGLARRFGSVTRIGAYLDPIADKLLLTGVYLALAGAGMVPWWLVILILSRDVLILAAAAFALLFTRLRKFPPSRWGKASTFFQILTAVAWMSQNVFPNPVFNSLASALVWPTAALTAWSGVHYAWSGITLLKSD